MTHLAKITTRDQAKKIASDLTIEVLEGNVNPLELWITLKGMEEMIKDLKDQTRDAAITEIEKYGKHHVIAGSKLSLNAGRRIFSYDHNPEWLELDQQRKEIERRMKTAITNTIVDPETGEVIPPAKVKHTTETISIELA